MMARPVIECSGVSFRYAGRQPALERLDLTVMPGELVLLAGATGSGKSTLCRLLSGLIPHLHAGEQSGRLLIDGHDVQVTAPHELSGSVGLLLQQAEAHCFGGSVARAIAFGPACQGLSRDEIWARVRLAASMLEIEQLLALQPDTLSGGQQQLVALAGALALQPRLLVLDEPFAYLDATGASRLRSTLRRLHQQGISIVVAEHRLGELVAQATRMLVLQAGRIVADAAPREVLQHDLAAWDLEPPALVQLARSSGSRSIPLSLDEALQLGLQADGALAGEPDRQAPAEASGQPALVWEGVWCARGSDQVLSGVDLVAPEGCRLALLGANGAGKTTLLHLGNGLLRAQRGCVLVQGQPIGRRPVAQIARVVGLVVQQPAHTLFAPTVRAELEVGPRALGRLDQRWCAQLVERFGLQALLDRPPQRLSVGEQRRVALAAVLAARPAVLLLDEPTIGQDAAGRAALRQALLQASAAGVATVVATHDTEWAARSSDVWAVLLNGRIVAQDAPRLLCQQPELIEHARLRMPELAALRHAIRAQEETHGYSR